MGPLVRPENQAVEPETIDYSTGAVMVDAVAVNDWSGEKSLSTRRYYDMLYSFDGTDIEQMPVRTTYWATDLQDKFRDIGILQRVSPEPLRAWNTSGRMRGQRDMEYRDYEGLEIMNEMMMEQMGRQRY